MTRNVTRWALVVAVVMLGSVCREGLGQGGGGAAEAKGRTAISLAVGLDSAAANVTSTSRFWLKGGSAELNAGRVRGLGLTASVAGLQAGNSGGGVPLNLLVVTFGPSYSLPVRAGKRPVVVFAHGLIGEANGFQGVYPQGTAPGSSSNGLAVKAGGGVDVGVSRHLSWRVVEANWLRTQLPNSTTNVQNDVELGTGLVFHSGAR